MTKPFECQRCGNCCLGPFPGNDEDIQVIAEYLNEPDIEGFIELHYEAHRKGYAVACMFYDWDEGCKINPVKPMKCVKYPIFLGKECAFGCWDWDVFREMNREKAEEMRKELSTIVVQKPKPRPTLIDADFL